MSSNNRSRLRKTSACATIGPLVAAYIEQHENDVLFRTCLSCLSWRETNEVCGKFGARPPAHIIVRSCPEYFDREEDIPF